MSDKHKTLWSSGPWKWYWREENGETDCGVFYEKNQGHCYSIARAPRYQTKEQWEADASLICAALDFADAARIAIESARGTPNPNEAIISTDALKAIVAALAKARGES